MWGTPAACEVFNPLSNQSLLWTTSGSVTPFTPSHPSFPSSEARFPTKILQLNSYLVLNRIYDDAFRRKLRFLVACTLLYNPPCPSDDLIIGGGHFLHNYSCKNAWLAFCITALPTRTWIWQPCILPFFVVFFFHKVIKCRHQMKGAEKLLVQGDVSPNEHKNWANEHSSMHRTRSAHGTDCQGMRKKRISF